MLEIGVNSYITIEEAEFIIRSRFMLLNEYRAFWSVLTNEEKESYLIQSCAQIETLIFVSEKKNLNQKLNFPRIFESDISQTVKIAQVYNALGYLNSMFIDISDKQMKTLQSLGIIKNTKYNKREMGEVGLGSTLTQETPAKVLELKSKTALELLKPYRFGSFKVR